MTDITERLACSGAYTIKGADVCNEGVAEIARLRAQVRELVEALEAAHSFIGDEYADAKSQALDGEHVSREARPVWRKICAALARARDEGDTP